MRFRASSRGLALSAALLLGLTACAGGDPEEEATASPTTTAPASASDGTASEGSSSEGSESDVPEEGEASDATSSDADSTEAGGSGDGGSDDGEYIPASEDGPAQNVPKPQMPEEMKEETEDGAKAAVQYWWDTMTYLQRTGDAEPMKAVSAETCTFCNSFADAMSTIYSEGGWHEGSTATVTSAVVWSNEGGETTVTTTVNHEEAKQYHKDGTEDPEGADDAHNDLPWRTVLHFDSDQGTWIVDNTWASGEEQ
ncbi:DUF6318 family protein [Micrococcus lylae]|uniref:DUF6318 family protein n=1 Tax=Micrococcus lylae TaxID=1273 RepID=UPI0021A3A53E|nr:DUF6318 family protein [Micrococcus lylae]MCT2006543.1 DUF6318 family protein [Micrococcus lylae]